MASLSCDLPTVGWGELGEGGANGEDARGEEERDRFWLLKVLLRELRDALDDGLGERRTVSERKASRALDSELKRLAGSEDGEDGEVLRSSRALGLEPRKPRPPPVLPLLLDLLRLSDVGTVSVLSELVV